jgi:hypothetical protein
MDHTFIKLNICSLGGSRQVMVYDASDPANRVHCRLAWAHPSEALAPATAGNTTASGTGKRTRGCQLQIYH